MMYVNYCRWGLFAATLSAGISTVPAIVHGEHEGSTLRVFTQLEREAIDWKQRMGALVQVAQDGSTAVPILLQKLEHGSAAQREFAAQALAMILEPSSRPALELASKSPELAVRGFARRALRGLRGLGPPEKEPSAAVKSVRAAVLEYRLEQIDSARIGRPAPDFSLISARGKPVRLSQFRGQTVILEFNGAYD